MFDGPLQAEPMTIPSSTSAGFLRLRIWGIKGLALVTGFASARVAAVLVGPWHDLLSDEAAALGQIGWYVEALKTPLPILVWALVYVVTKRLLLREPVFK